MSSLEDSQLSGVLLFLSFVVQSQNGLIQHTGKKRHLLYLLLFRHSSQFTLERYRNFGFKEFFFCSADMLLIVLMYQNS